MYSAKIPCLSRISSNEKTCSLLLRRFAFKSDLKIKWVRPEKISCIRPEKSGDIEGLPRINKTQLAPKFSNSKELETADETVKKLFTLEFAPRKDTNEFIYNSIMDKVKQHNFDVSSAEVKIAKWTGKIRAMQEVMERFPRNLKSKVTLKELIERRKKHLKWLRERDYKRFEWLLENLNVVYKPNPAVICKPTRKDSLRKLTAKYCEDIKQQRLDNYQAFLKSEQPAFLEEKMRMLAFIKEEQKECDVEVTVTDAEIEDIRKQLDELKKKEDHSDQM
ncbi:hypothetical protein NQ315_011464 [Exocentrus adspersus]|uniref:Small ribosomal subunit protein uS15m n=1 Tax=Exocentrus adspersus TaxID=1586481 RepID=A0AAV8VWI0_9CUCU|nr:hypothetical protein NQ315_011464 [Exocentrus adspersus]